jgi:hypothetical protein
MKKAKICLFFALVLLLGLGTSIDAEAQCAMCRATVENNLSDGSTSVGAGLNRGILYLVSFPYLVFIVLAYFWYRNSKANQVQRMSASGFSGQKLR